MNAVNSNPSLSDNVVNLSNVSYVVNSDDITLSFHRNDTNDLENVAVDSGTSEDDMQMMLQIIADSLAVQNLIIAGIKNSRFTAISSTDPSVSLTVTTVGGYSHHDSMTIVYSLSGSSDTNNYAANTYDTVSDLNTVFQEMAQSLVDGV